MSKDTLRETTTFQNRRYRTHESSMSQTVPDNLSKTKRLIHPPVDGYTVWHWPEFQVLLKKLGVDTELPITSTTIEVPIDDCVRVTLEFLGLDTTVEK